MSVQQEGDVVLWTFAHPHSFLWLQTKQSLHPLLMTSDPWPCCCAPGRTVGWYECVFFCSLSVPPLLSGSQTHHPPECEKRHLSKTCELCADCLRAVRMFETCSATCVWVWNPRYAKHTHTPLKSMYLSLNLFFFQSWAWGEFPSAV